MGADLAGWTTLYVPTFHMHCSVMGKATYDEQRVKNRDGKGTGSSPFVFHLNCNEGRRAGKSVVLQGSIQDPLRSKHQLLFFPHTPAPLWHSGLQ